MAPVVRGGRSRGLVGPGDARRRRRATRVELREVHRFPNRPVRLRRHAALGRARAVGRRRSTGLRAAGARTDSLAGIGVDSWAIDYAPARRRRGTARQPRALPRRPHRRRRRAGGRRACELYPITGVQQLPFNTVYQLVAARDRLGDAARGARPADPRPVRLLAHRRAWQRADQRLDHRAVRRADADLVGRRWSTRLGLRGRAASRRSASRASGSAPVLPAVAGGGRARPRCRSSRSARTTPRRPCSACPPATSGSPTSPAAPGRWSASSCAAPVTSRRGRARPNFSNELGVDGTVRFLRNVMGLWLLQECVRTWERAGAAVDLPRLLAEAADAAGAAQRRSTPTVPSSCRRGTCRRGCARSAAAPASRCPTTPAEITRCILDSLAAAYRRTVQRGRRRCPAPASRSCTWSAAARRTRCCAS